MFTECLLCNRGIDHCHGTLVQHSDDTVECTEVLCDFPQFDQHELVLECWQVAGGCGCAETATSAVAG